MKKDIFKGKIKQEHIATALFSIIFGAIVFLACGVLFMCMAMFYDNIEDNGRRLMYVVSVICYVCSVFYPVASLVGIRTYPKHKKLAHLLLKEYVFEEIPDDSETTNTPD